jgi:hypothetical protein
MPRELTLFRVSVVRASALDLEGAAPIRAWRPAVKVGKMRSIGSSQTRVLGALIFAILLTGCYDTGWGGGSPGYGPYYGGAGYSSYYGAPPDYSPYYGSSGYVPGYDTGYSGGNTYYTKNVYRGYNSNYPEPDLNRSEFGVYAPANETWAASTRGRASYGASSYNSGHTFEANNSGNKQRNVAGNVEHGSVNAEHSGNSFPNGNHGWSNGYGH